jgi:hypothetical protein
MRAYMRGGAAERALSLERGSGSGSRSGIDIVLYCYLIDPVAHLNHF